MSEIATMQDLQTKVKEKINSVFMELIPPELMDQLIQKAIEDWQRNELPKLVSAILSEKYKTGINELVNTHWNGNTHTPTEAMQEIIKKCIPNLMENFFTNAVMTSVSKINNRGY